MKTIRASWLTRFLLLLFTASLLFVAEPVLAVDPHAAYYSTLAAPVTLNTATMTTLLTFTVPTTVGSGTNSYLVFFWVKYRETMTVGNQTQLQLVKTISSTTTVLPNTLIGLRGGEGWELVMGEIESIADASTISLQGAVTATGVLGGDTLVVTAVRAIMIGLDGATQ